MRKTLLMAAAAAALMATPVIAQEVPNSDPASQPPSTDPVGTPLAAEVQDTADVVEETAPTADVTATVEAEAEVADASSANDIVDVMRADGQFTTLLSALDASGLTATLESDDSISILAPTDAAFAALPAGELDRLMLAENREELRELLLYHVVNADVRAEQIENRRGPVVTGSGAQVLFDGVDGLKVDAANITNADLRGDNGAVLVVDQVLSPDTSLAAQGDAEAEAGVEADATTGAETAAEAEAGAEVTAPEAPVDPAATADEPTGEEMPATPPVAPEEEPAEPTDETDPTTPQS